MGRISGARLTCLLLKRGLTKGYLPEPDKYLFIVDSPNQETTAQQEFHLEGLEQTFVS